MASAARRIWEYVMEYAIRTDPTLRDSPDDWYEIAIQAPRAPNVDVGRNSSAQLAELTAGVTTYDEIYGARGIDWRSALEAKAQQAKYIQDLAAKYGLDVSEISTAQKQPIAPEPAEMAAEVEPSGTMPEEIPAQPIQEVVAVAKKRKPRSKKSE
jgi:hypothetical protein